MTHLNQDQIDRYLARIGLAGPLSPSAESLAAIQWAHLHSVPFENLDIVSLGRPLSLAIDGLFQKIVIEHRGGYCFELNGLLAVLLESLGYSVARKGGWFAEDADPFDHLLLEVTVPGDRRNWYADVGAGRSNPDYPIPLGENDPDGRWRTRFAEGLWRAEELSTENEWRPVLHWRPETRSLGDFRARCHYFETDPASFFRQGSIVSMRGEGGRITLAEGTLITTLDGVRTERELGEPGEIRRVLQSRFGIDLPAGLTIG